jgi:NAD(P)-dependent dehydrogenase (short-subunit alcohol dehydrogenase family)
MASPKVVLVTGGNNGIGYETVKAFLQSDKSYHVLLGSRSLEKAKLAIETLHKECPESTNTIEAVQVDLTSDKSIQKASEQVKASPGHIDALVNNAGMHTFLYTMTFQTNVSQGPRSIPNSSPAKPLSATASPRPTT